MASKRRVCPSNSAAWGVLRKHGIERVHNETPNEALSRHAKVHSWHADEIDSVRTTMTAEARDLFKKHIKEANTAFNSLEAMNDWLKHLDRAPQLSKTQARKILATIHINIFDLLDGNFNIHASVRELAAYTRHTHLVFPRAKAKAQGLRCFLRHLQ